MIYFVGAGPGAIDLITVRGINLLKKADVIVYAGSLVNPELLNYAHKNTQIHDSASMTLEAVLEVLVDAHNKDLTAVRLHTGDPSLYGAIKEQIDALHSRSIPCECVPGVSSFCAAAAALKAEYTLPGVSQTLIITRMEGRTPVPKKEEIKSLAAHGASMAIFLSSGMLDKLTSALIEGGYSPDTPAALVYKASWPDEKTYVTTLKDIPKKAAQESIKSTALVLVGDFLNCDYDLSKLYDASFSHAFRKAEIKNK